MIRLPLLHDIVVMRVVVPSVDVVRHLQQLSIVRPRVRLEPAHPAHALRQLPDHGVEGVLKPAGLARANL